MIAFEDGRQFQVAGTVLADGSGNTIPFSAITIVSRPSSFTGSVVGIAPPISYVKLSIVGEAAHVVAAMSLADYNKIALSSVRKSAAPSVSPMQRAAGYVRRKCGSCGR